MDIHCNAVPQYERNIIMEAVMKKLSILGIIVGATLLTAAPLSVQWSPETSVAVSLDRADARVGRPATATSVAGAARRAGRRAYRRSYY